MFENESSVIKVDFHMHTRRDKEFSYTGPEKNFIKAYVDKMAFEALTTFVLK